LKNLLIVDDEDLLVENMKFILAPYATKVFTARNGKEGMQILEREKIHCVISDLTMPIMSGIEFLKETRQRKIDVPFIIYSGYLTSETISEISRYGVRDILRKPDFKNIEGTVASAMNEGSI
jgi:two-component system response regulator YesN